MARIAGTCFIKADDIQFEVQGDVEAPLSAVLRESVESLQNKGHYSEKDIVPYVKVTALFVPDLDLDKIGTSTNLTVVAEMANGRVYTLTNAYLVGDAAIKGTDGNVSLEFNGASGQWSAP